MGSRTTTYLMGGGVFFVPMLLHNVQNLGSQNELKGVIESIGDEKLGRVSVAVYSPRPRGGNAGDARDERLRWT